MRKLIIKQPSKNLTKEQWIGNPEPVARLTVEIPREKYYKFKEKLLKNKKNVADVVREFVDKYIDS